jgi:hypothetical protein
MAFLRKNQIVGTLLYSLHSKLEINTKIGKALD